MLSNNIPSLYTTTSRMYAYSQKIKRIVIQFLVIQDRLFSIHVT